MLQVRQTEAFQRWVANLKDRHARAAITARIDRAKFGNFGDRKAVGTGVSEMRIDIGPGYRIYYTRKGASLLLLLAGGTKASQSSDIKRAVAMLAGES